MGVEQCEDRMFLSFRTTDRARARVLRRNLVWMESSLISRDRILESEHNIFEEKGFAYRTWLVDDLAVIIIITCSCFCDNGIIVDAAFLANEEGVDKKRISRE